MTDETLQWIASALIGATPLVILLFLTSFLVWMGKGRHDTPFTRFCERAMVPAGLASVALILVSLRYF